MGENGRRRVKEHFDWERKGDRILEIYADAIHADNTTPVESQLTQ